MMWIQPIWRKTGTAALMVFSSVCCASPVLSAPADGAAQEEVIRDFEKTLTLGAGQGVAVEHQLGDVRVHGHPGREVNIRASIHVQMDSRAESEALADRIKIEVEQGGPGVQVRTVYPDDLRHGGSGHVRISYSVSYDIAVPADAALHVKDSFGGITVSGVRGQLDLDTSHGSVFLQDGGPGRVNNSFGSVEVTGVAGALSVTDTNGSVQIADVKGALDLRNRFGTISVRNIQGAASINGGNGSVALDSAGSATITSSFGTVEARDIRGDLTIRDNNGNVEVSAVGGFADLTNSFGNVTFSEVKGRVNCVSSNGRVKGTAIGAAGLTVRNAYGQIELENIAGNVSAETSNGRVTVHDARGTVELRSSFGAVEASSIPKGIRAITGNGAVNLTDIGGDAFAKTTFGSVNADRINGNLQVENTNGSVTARNVKGDATVTTSFAGVTLESIGGRISVDNQNGAVSIGAVRSATCREISVKTSFAPIRVRIPDNVGFNVNARTSFGRISSELPVTATGSMGEDTLGGTIHGGGCQLQLSNSNGSIEIVKAS